MKNNLIINNDRKTAFFFSISSIVFNITQMVSALLVLRWLTPDKMGYWNSIILFQNYSSFAQLGLFTGLSRELPFLYGKKKEKKAIKYAEIAQFVSKFLMYFSFILGLCIVLFLILKDYEKFKIFSILVMSIVVSLNFYQNYLLVTFRSNQSFGSLSIVYIIYTLILIFSLLFVILWGYDGFLIRYVLITISLTVLYFIYRPLKIKSSFNWKHYLKLLKIGFPFFSLAYIQTLTSSFTRIAILYFSNFLIVGLFSPALGVISAMTMIPSTIAQYLSPKMSYAYGETESKKEIWDYIKKSSFFILLILIPIIFIGYCLIPIFISSFFPMYTEGTTAARLVLVSGLFNALTISNNSLITVQAMKPFLFLTIFKFASYFIVIFSFAYFSPNILNGVALGYFISEILFGITSIMTCYVILNKND